MFTNSVRFSRILASCVCSMIAFSSLLFAQQAAKSSAETVPLFQGIQEGKIEAKIIFKDRKKATVTLANKTDKPLNVNLPEVIGASPILAQLGQKDNNNNEGGLQDMMGALGQRNFMIPPEKVVREDAIAVCLEHGKKDPNPKTDYQIKPIGELTAKPEVIELGRLMTLKEFADHEIIQMAVWMINNNMTPQQLGEDTWKSATGKKSPAYSRAQLKTAAALAQFVTEKVKTKPVQTTEK